MGVLLRADLTEHSQFSQSADFCQKRWDGRALFGQPSKGHSCRISILFPWCFTIFVAPNIKKLETYFVLQYFLIFAQFEECFKGASFQNLETSTPFRIHSSDFIGFFFFIFCSSVSVSSNSSEELRQQIRRHKATRPPIEEEEPEKTNQDSQDSVHSMYSFSNRILLCTCLENLRCTINWFSP